MALRGVNLGGWLVLERWLTPSVFDGVDAQDEYAFMQTPEARAKLHKHQREFIRESDFKWLRDNGVQAVRIPVGYWILAGDNPFVASIGRLDWAFKMAEKYNLEVLICLHGAPGSQNGRDHSGRAGKALWYKSKLHRQQTINTLEQLALRYRNSPRFWGIELLNEPRMGVFQLKLRSFYRQAYRSLTDKLSPGTRIVYSDAFTPHLMNAVLSGGRHRVAMDIHWYHFAFWAHKLVPLAAYWRLVWYHKWLINRLQQWQGVIVGEWSGVLSHESLARYPTPRRSAMEHQHLSRQLAAYQSADAWFYWTYKTEGNDMWNFRHLVDSGQVTL